MQKLVSLFTTKSLDRSKSLSAPGTSVEKTYSLSSDSVSSGSFANLKLTAGKPGKEQACAKTDLDLANSKLTKLTEYIQALEEKVQSTINENAKLKEKQKEDEKLWKGLESKFSSTKTLCDQLTGTLQHLAGLVPNSENDTEFLEDKLFASGVALDNLHQQMKTLSLKLNASEDALRKCEKEYQKLTIEKQENEKSFEDKVNRAANLIQEKDAKVKHLEATVEANREDIDSLSSKIENLHLSLRLKDDDLKSLRVSEETLVKEKNDLLSINEKFIRQLDMALRERKNLEDFIKLLAGKLVELDNQSMAYLKKFVLLNALYDSCSKLVQEEKDLGLQCAKKQHDQIHEKFLHVTSEKEKLQLITEELNCKIIGLQKDQDTALIQRVEDIHELEGKIQELESEAESLLSTKSQLELLITASEDKIMSLSYNSRISESKLNSRLTKLTEHIRALEEKLQSTLNENSKLKVKQKEDEKLWKGLESKFSLTKTLCDQLTETLQHLAGQVHNGENDKEFLEDKLSVSGAALDNLYQQMKTLSLKLDASEDAVRKCEKEFDKLSIEKQEIEKSFEEKVCRAANLIQVKDARVKHLEAIVEANREDIDSLNSKIENLHLSLRLKDDNLKNLSVSEETLVKEKSDLLSINEKFIRQLDVALRERKDLEDFIKLLDGKLVELDNQSMAYLEKFVLLDALYDSCSKLVQEEKDLGLQCAKMQYDQIHEKYLLVTTEKEELQLMTEGLNCKIIGLQNDQETVLIQHVEDIHEAEGKIQELESEAEILLSTKSQLELLITASEEKIKSLSYNSTISESKLQDLLAKISVLESESKDSTTKLLEEIQIKTEEADSLKKEIENNAELVDSIQKQVNDLQTLLEEKGELILQFKEREKLLENQKSEVQVSLTDAENKLAEARRQYDQMLESKQSELLRHLRELSQRNDNAINDIRRKFEADKLESLNLEKEKAKRALQEMERKHEEMVAECKEEARKYMAGIQEEHATLIIHMQQDHDKKEMALKSDHREEIKRFKVQAENELLQKTMQLKSEKEIQLNSLKRSHEDECRKLHEELQTQKDKEEKQRKLLQLQWKVMGDNLQENSKKNYSMTRNSGSNKRSQRDLVHMESDQEEVETGNPAIVINIPKHSKKVTHHEYEVETANGRTITKRTKRTVMFGDARKQKKRQTPEVNTPSAMVKGIKGSKKNSSNLGDLFREWYLDPYAHDPYTFG